MLDEHAEALKEHFDAVFIVCSRDFPENEKLTQILSRGRGNWFAQRGMLREVLENDQAKTLAIHVVSEEEKRDGQ